MNEKETHVNAANINEIVAKIAAEIERLDAEDCETNCYGICCYLDEDLPLGWVRIGDGTGATAYAPAVDILAALEAVEYDRDATVERFNYDISESETVQRDNGWELAWEAIAEVDQPKPDDSYDWPSDLFTTEQIEEGTPNDNPITLIQIQTNAGIRYACGPHGVSECALAEALRYDALYETREEAIESVE